jgi:hypothetical protein
MSRRALLEGIADTVTLDPQIEEAFIRGKTLKPKPPEEPKEAKPAPKSVQTAPQPGEGKGQGAGALSRIGLTTRMRADFAEALKRASLERQLQKVKPNTLQDILEEALEPWLRSNGYLN